MPRSSGLSFLLRWLVVTAIFCSGEVHALDPARSVRQYVHRIWQTDLGLPAVRAIAQSRDGYLLLGGQGGLMKFDGVRFSPVNTDWVRNILEDGRGRIWAGTNDSGIIRTDHGTVKRFTRLDGLPSDHVTCLVLDHNGDVWACTLDGLVRFSGDNIHVYQTRQGLPVNGLLSACLAQDGTLWMGTNTPLIASWNGSMFQSITL